MTDTDELKVNLLVAEVNYAEAIKRVFAEFNIEPTWKNAQLWIERDGPARVEELQAMKAFFS